jgi:hypothetical protein
MQVPSLARKNRGNLTLENCSDQGFRKSFKVCRKPQNEELGVVPDLLEGPLKKV